MNEAFFPKTIYVALGLFCGFFLGFLWEVSTLKIGHMAYRNGYHYHHSLFGLVAFLLLPKFWDDPNKAFFVVGFGIGMITQHTVKEGFIFITKD